MVVLMVAKESGDDIEILEDGDSLVVQEEEAFSVHQVHFTLRIDL